MKPRRPEDVAFPPHELILENHKTDFQVRACICKTEFFSGKKHEGLSGGYFHALRTDAKPQSSIRTYPDDAESF